MRRILVIDDDSSIRSLFKRGLGYEHFEVKVAESGEQGLALLASEEPDVVILDVKMPGMNGFDVLQSIRQTGSKVPVIMLTALDSIETQLECFNAGADDYVPKPVGFDVLLARIRAVQIRNGGSVSARLRFPTGSRMSASTMAASRSRLPSMRARSRPGSRCASAQSRPSCAWLVSPALPSP